MKLMITSHATAMRSCFLVPTLGVAGEQSAFFRVRGNGQVASPKTGDAGMTTGHRPWSPLIT